jgi:NADH-quinone oxidoreductase subunit H
MELSVIIFKAVLLIIIFTISLVVAMYSTYGERKVAAFMQDRLGPNRAGKWGLLQPVADGVKMFMKEEIVPLAANKNIFILGPSIAMFTACMSSAVIPWGGELVIGGKIYSMNVADLNIGILYVFAIVSLGVYGIMFGGWASNNKYSLLGAIRAASQMISYELAMGMAIIALIMVNGSLSLTDIVDHQRHGVWNVLVQPLGFLIFLITAFAETNRSPFDLPECETELIGGFHTEYSSMKLGFFLFSEYINMFVSSAVISTLYFGGYDMPFIDKLGLAPNVVTLLGTGFLFAKILFFVFFFMWIRWTLPRFRYDQLMNLGWKVLLPLSILNIIITGAVILFL